MDQNGKVFGRRTRRILRVFQGTCGNFIQTSCKMNEMTTLRQDFEAQPREVGKVGPIDVSNLMQQFGVSLSCAA